MQKLVGIPVEANERRYYLIKCLYMNGNMFPCCHFWWNECSIDEVLMIVISEIFSLEFFLRTASCYFKVKCQPKFWVITVIDKGDNRMFLLLTLWLILCSWSSTCTWPLCSNARQGKWVKEFMSFYSQGLCCVMGKNVVISIAGGSKFRNIYPCVRLHTYRLRIGILRYLSGSK